MQISPIPALKDLLVDVFSKKAKEMLKMRTIHSLIAHHLLHSSTTILG